MTLTLALTIALPGLTATTLKGGDASAPGQLRMLPLSSSPAIAATGARPAPSGGRTNARGNQSWQWRYRVWMPKHWQNLAVCESGSNPPNWRHDSGTYQGAFGFHYGSWDQYKPVAGWPSNAADATPWQQWRTALRIAARFGIAEPWGCWRGPEHAWVRNGLPEHGTYR